MKSWTPPTAKEIDHVAALSVRSENRAYFFERLDNPEWVLPLSSRGFFESPPPPIAAPEPGYVRFPPWPEGRYLARMASSAPENVAGVLATIGSSENPTVTRLLLEAVVALPESLASSLAEQVRDWITGPHADFYADDAATVVLHLVNAGEVGYALEIVSSLLEVIPDPRLSEKRVSTDEAYRLTPEASSRVSEWEYERVVEQVLEPLVDAGGLDTVQMFSALLCDALRLSRWEDEVGDEEDADYSYIWRPAIEDHSQNLNSGVKNVLVSAVRDAASRYVSGGATEVNAAVNDLEKGSITHRRIALHVLANTGLGTELATARAADRDLFDDYRLRHEYADLLRNRFGHVGEDAQSEVLTWIESGPDVDSYRERWTERNGTEPSDDDVQRYADIWQRDRFSYIAEFLAGSASDRYQDLVQAYGEPEHPDFTSWSASWVGPESPFDRERLLQLPPSEVAALLRSWRPDDDSEGHFGPSIEGFGRVFSGVVAARSADYAAKAQGFADLDPTYVREFFSGLEQALAKGEAFSWEEPLRLASWVSQQAFEPDDDLSDRDRDPGWRWCRRQIASLVRSGFSAKENGISLELRENVWDIIVRLIDDPNPSPEHEARYGGDNMDPLTLSLNTNRGETMHAAIEYALWVHRDVEARGGDVSSGFDLMPEVRTLLERHLDLIAEPSHAVRAVYGRWLPWLVLLDKAWTAANLRAIFPADHEANAYADTAWSTYVTWCPPYDSAFRVLRSEYEDAVRRVPSGQRAGSRQRESIDVKLGEHLVTLFWRGELDRGLLEEFFERAGDELSAGVLGFVGRALRNTPGDLSAPIRQRMEELFEWRLTVGEAAPEQHQLEIGSFGIWFSSGKLEDAWSLEMLQRVVDLVGAPAFGHSVVDRLVDVARTDPVAAVDLLAGMLARPENEWDDSAWRDSAEEILSIARDSGVPEVGSSMREIVDLYVRRGRTEFRVFAPQASDDVDT